MRFFHVVIAAWMLAGLIAIADPPAAKGQSKKEVSVSAADIDRLILQLGDDDAAKRTAARKQLEAIGGPALAILKKAAETADDPEVRKAAKAIAGETRLESPWRYGRLHRTYPPSEWRRH